MRVVFFYVHSRYYYVYNIFICSGSVGCLVRLWINRLTQYKELKFIPNPSHPFLYSILLSSYNFLIFLFPFFFHFLLHFPFYFISQRINFIRIIHEDSGRFCYVNFYAPLMSPRFLLSSTTRTIRYRGLGTERFKYVYLCITIVK